MEDSSICYDEDVATQAELGEIKDGVEHCYTCFVNVLKCSLISIYGESKLNRGDCSNYYPAADHKFCSSGSNKW